MKVTGDHVHSSWGKSPGPCLLMTARQILHGSQTKLRVAPKRKTSAAAKHLREQTADCTALQSQIDWTSNHGTIERKTSNRSRIWSAAGWCPAATMPPDANSMYLKERLLISLNPQKFVLARSNSKSHKRHRQYQLKSHRVISGTEKCQKIACLFTKLCCFH